LRYSNDRQGGNSFPPFFFQLSSIAGLAVFGFVCQVADPIIGGTYITMMTTLMNMGVLWPQSLAQAVNDRITWKHCYGNATESVGDRHSFRASPKSTLDSR
jgi:hypothetical protein